MTAFVGLDIKYHTQCLMLGSKKQLSSYLLFLLALWTHGLVHSRQLCVPTQLHSWPISIHPKITGLATLLDFVLLISNVFKLNLGSFNE